MAVQLTYHGSPYASNILQEGFKAGKPTGGFGWKVADLFQKGAKTLTTPSQSLASMYGKTIPVASSIGNITLPSGAITKSGIGLGTEVIQTPEMATKGKNLVDYAKSLARSGTASRLLGGETVSGLGGATATGGFLRSLIGSNLAYGAPFAYASAASALQKDLEKQGLTGKGGIADISGLWGAEAAGADVEYDIDDVYDEDEKETITFNPNDPKVKQAGLGVKQLWDIYRAYNVAKKVKKHGPKVLGTLKGILKARDAKAKVPTDGGGGISNINIQKRNIGMPEHLTYTPPRRTVTPRHAPHPHRGGGGPHRGGGGMGKGKDPGGGAAGSPFKYGGRIDKALGGRSKYL